MHEEQMPTQEQREAVTASPRTFEDICVGIRHQAKGLENACRNMMDHEKFMGEQRFPGQHGEMKANLMLAVRHFEDARMRIGKVLQYNGDGVSCFDK